MKFILSREDLLKPLQLVSGAVERRQTLPILLNVLISVKNQQLTITATDLEVELTSRVKCEEVDEEGEVTVSARKLLDICRSLPNEASIQLMTDKNRLEIQSDKSRFILATLPASEFPNVEESKDQAHITLPQDVLKKVLENTGFAVAQQDVRYYLNGMLFDLTKNGLKLVATDGHRLALGHISEVKTKEKGNFHFQVIVPRKGIMELMRLLADQADEIEITIGTNHIHATTADFTFTSKLIEGKFPDYSRVIPKNSNKVATVEREKLKSALTRAAILSNEKYRGVRLLITPGTLIISANNPEQEEVEEEISVDYDDAEIEIGFNVSYLIDICHAINTAEMKWTFLDANSSALIEYETEICNYVYVVMPMRL